MLSRRASGWKFYDWIVFVFIVIVVCVLIRMIDPNSGVAHALHLGFHALVLFLQWIAIGLNNLAGLLNQL